MRGIPFIQNWKFMLCEPESPHLLATDETSWRTLVMASCTARAVRIALYPHAFSVSIHPEAKRWGSGRRTNYPDGRGQDWHT